MYDILFKETYPSWFYSTNQGVTTMWELWDSFTKKDGFHKDDMNSFNHYAYYAIGCWMYECITGIKPTKVAYKEIEFAPVPGGPLTSASASYNSPYGLVSSSWEVKEVTMVLSIAVPPNTTGKVMLPVNANDEVLLNGKTLTIINKENNRVIVEVTPGHYTFETKLK